MFYTAQEISKRFAIKITSKISNDEGCSFFKSYSESKSKFNSYFVKRRFCDKSLLEFLEDFNSIKTYAYKKSALNAIKKYGLESDKVNVEVVAISSLGYSPAF